MKYWFIKLKWIAALGLVFGVVLMTNQVDKKNFQNIKSSMETIYQDRLLVKGYIYDLSSLLEEKKIALYTNDTSFYNGRIDVVNDSIKAYINKFSGTKLVDDESRLLQAFQQKTNQLNKLEETGELTEEKRSVMINQLNELSSDLYKLSRIQLAEGKRQMFIAQKSVDLTDLFTRIEMIILIVIAVVVQLIILYKPSKS